MDRPLLREQAPAEYFKELVESALARQHVQAGDLTAYYLVNLLCQFVRPDARVAFGPDDEPLAIRLTRALQTGGSEQRARLRSLGDFSLFMSGFFSDSLRRRTVDVDYYVSMGEYAYGSLSHREEDAFAVVFRELARKFVGFMDVLADVSERTAVTSGTDVMRLYEKWLRTGSPRDGQKLVDRGIVPNISIGKRFLQYNTRHGGLPASGLVGFHVEVRTNRARRCGAPVCDISGTTEPAAGSPASKGSIRGAASHERRTGL